MPPTDADAIRRSLDEPAAFGAVFDRHYAAVHAYAQRRVGAELAEEVAAEAFARAFAARKRYDGAHADALPWLLGIASNLMRRHWRTEKRRLAVDAEEWLRALPASAVAPRAQAATVEEMLEGIPVPPGFEAPEATGETRDRYQLGARVTGAVACAWIERGGKEAAAALATSRRWPILLEMNAEGDYPEVLWQYADALNGKSDIPAGKLGLTIDATYKDALGC